MPTTRMVCPTHGESEFVLRPDGGTRCKRCRSDAVTMRRRRVKATLVAEAGGKCLVCGYDRYPGALAFHHVDPATKVNGIAEKGRALSIQALRAEAAKCVLLCHNCHAEVEAGLVAVPIHLIPPATAASWCGRDQMGSGEIGSRT